MFNNMVGCGSTDGAKLPLQDGILTLTLLIALICIKPLSDPPHVVEQLDQPQLRPILEAQIFSRRSCSKTFIKKKD